MSYTQKWQEFLLEIDSDVTVDDDATIILPSSDDDAEIDKAEPVQRKLKGINAFFDSLGLVKGDFLGGGQHGQVYQAIDKRTGKRFAIKLVGNVQKRLGPSWDPSDKTATDPVREVANYKFVKRNRNKFGDAAAMLPIVYSSSFVDVPVSGEEIGGTTTKMGVIVMEELVPLPADLARRLFASSGSTKRGDFERRDQLLFADVDILRGFLVDVLTSSRAYRLDVTPENANEIANYVIQHLRDPSKPPSNEALLKAEQELLQDEGRGISRFGIRIYALMLDGLDKIVNSRLGFRSAKTSIDYAGGATSLDFLKKYSRPLRTTDADREDSSVMSGFEQYDTKGHIQKTFPEVDVLSNKVDMLKRMGLKPRDVHSQNVMMRPATKDIVIVDLGNFGIQK